jgi:hypothetical protein
MSGKWMFRLTVLAGFVGGSWGLCHAAPPREASKSLNADREQSHAITQENGPWMIMAYSFSGDDAAQRARELVTELRQQYKLKAYTYEGRFDLGEAAGRGIDKYGNPCKFKYYKQNSHRVELDEVAVLVGDYASADDSDAQKTLKKLKFANPKCLETKKDDQAAAESLTGWRHLQNQIYTAMGGDKEKEGMMFHAFIAPNPLLPPDFFTPKAGLDPEVLAMNKDVAFSLLDCPGKYTVQVATFKGTVIIKQEEIMEIQNGNKDMDVNLAKADEKADRLTKALRAKGYEAYQFRDCSASIVTIGSFNSVGTPMDDGRIEINPDIHKIMNLCKAQPITLPGQAASGNTKLATLAGIPFDVQPMPVEVPKRSLSVAMRKDNRE